ncbi:MAG: tripartite tricarboxylate transporter substrate binding protein, partial [Burkholderiales bacterium]
RFVTLGADAWTMRPDQFEVYIRDEIKSNAVLVKAAGLSPAP